MSVNAYHSNGVISVDLDCEHSAVPICAITVEDAHNLIEVLNEAIRQAHIEDRNNLNQALSQNQGPVKFGG